MYTSVHNLCSILCWCTSGNNYSLVSLWVWCYQLGTPSFGQFFPFFFSEPLRLRQLEWGVVTYCRCPVGRWSSAPLWGLEPSIHCCIHLAVDPALSPKSRCWKTSPQHEAATTALHCREGIGQVMSLVSSWYCAWQRVQFLFKHTRKFSF